MHAELMIFKTSANLLNTNTSPLHDDDSVQGLHVWIWVVHPILAGRSQALSHWMASFCEMIFRVFHRIRFKSYVS